MNHDEPHEIRSPDSRSPVIRRGLAAPRRCQKLVACPVLPSPQAVVREMKIYPLPILGTLAALTDLMGKL
ncbi:hypothetical protein PC116_g33482 [Phytophthora cactorum]|nr:hypothetical protein PC116_g33482 [Phytophthora cactorum]